MKSLAIKNQNSKKSNVHLNSMIDLLNRIDNGFLFVRNKKSIKKLFDSLLKDIDHLNDFDFPENSNLNKFSLTKINEAISDISVNGEGYINFFYKQNFFYSIFIGEKRIKIEQQALFVIFDKKKIYIIFDEDDMGGEERANPSIVLSYLRRNFFLNLDEMEICLHHIKKEDCESYLINENTYFEEKYEIESAMKRNVLN